MIFRNNNFPNYVIKKSGDSLAMFREGREKPLKPIKGYKNDLVYNLWKHGFKKRVKIEDFLQGHYLSKLAKSKL